MVVRREEIVKRKGLFLVNPSSGGWKSVGNSSTYLKNNVRIEEKTLCHI